VPGKGNNSRAGRKGFSYRKRGNENQGLFTKKASWQMNLGPQRKNGVGKKRGQHLAEQCPWFRLKYMHATGVCNKRKRATWERGQKHLPLEKNRTQRKNALVAREGTPRPWSKRGGNGKDAEVGGGRGQKKKKLETQQLGIRGVIGKGFRGQRKRTLRRVGGGGRCKVHSVKKFLKAQNF